MSVIFIPCEETETGNLGWCVTDVVYLQKAEWDSEGQTILEESQ